MKKTIFLSLLLIIGIIHSSLAAERLNLSPGDPSPAAITSLVVNADVTIILLNDASRPAYMKGDAFFMEQISLHQTEGKLVIKAQKKKNFIGKGLIYVPASQLANIEVNSAAHIRTFNILPIPNLTLSINGDCKVHIATVGKIDLVGNDSYEIDYQVSELSFPATMQVKKVK